MPLTGRMPTQGIQKQQNDSVENRQRVATHIDGNTVSYEDTNFTVADDQSILNVFNDLGRTGFEGYLANDGPGDMQYEVSFDGSVYGGLTTLRGGEAHTLNNLKINKIRLSFVDPTEYRAKIG